jgi:REP element-mobilizing transposase RayT/CheY-like chemotaxis protein
MAAPVLIATRTAAFGDLIQQTLEHSQLYQPVRVDSGAEALRLVIRAPFAAAILDCDLQDIPQARLAHLLRKIRPDIRLIAVPPDQDCSSLDLAGVPYDGCLTKPFYLPDLLKIVEEAIQSERRVKTPEPCLEESPIDEFDDDAPPWLQDVDRAAQYLTRLTLESAAQAALIVFHRRIWAYAGELSQAAAEELACLAVHYQEKDGSSDVARFVRLGQNGGEYMLYAVRLGWGMTLALVYDAETPFSKIRSQAGKLAKALATPPAPEAGQDGGAEYDEQQMLDEALANLPPLFENDIPPPKAKIPVMPEPSRLPPQSEPGRSVPLPETRWEEGDEKDQESPGRQEEQAGVDREPYMWVNEGPPAGAATRADAGSEEKFQQEEKQAVEIDPSLPIELQVASPALYALSYTCLLVPRLPQQRLAGDIAAELARWIPQLCLAYGFRLLHLSIRPDNLEWILEAPPAVSPGAMMAAIRQKTSQKIFEVFPRLVRENPSGDYWAPGYLVISSRQPLPSHIRADFIRQTRIRQGASNISSA